jgi:predicted DNA-binding antitoxin AbrB/MazE fold protein
MQVKAIYENGVFRPLQLVQLAERQEVTVTIDHSGGNAPANGEQVLFSLTPERWQSFCDALDAAPKPISALHKLLTDASLFESSPIDEFHLMLLMKDIHASLGKP